MAVPGQVPGERRKTVTVVFCDLVESTSLGEELDPESMHALLGRYSERLQRIVAFHGGSVEKFIGDAVMAVFGVPVVHEDDALRAVRAVIEMQGAIAELGLQGRIGVATGEVVTADEQRLATGDAVNVAARLEQAAAPGEALIGQATFDLVGAACSVEAIEPLALKGKTGRVAAFRLLGVHEAPARPSSPFVGRQREREALRAVWRRILAERRCELVTVVGDAGIGKSRLVAELAAELDATVAHGRCLSYGEGITYWPVASVLRQLDPHPVDERVASALGSLLGRTGPGTSADEIAWAFRRALEEVAAQRPLFVVFDDVQWGEQTFLDLIEQVALLSTAAPILLACIARPELLDRRPGWPVTLRLEPLADDEAEELISEGLDARLRARIRQTAAGNPLFIQEMLAMADVTRGEAVVPATLQSLLAARLDLLDEGERLVLEYGAVEGDVFHSTALQALVPEQFPVLPRLTALVRKQLIRPVASQLPGEDAFRFCHLLMRDAAYAGLSKRTRAELHAAFGSWLERHNDLVELDEVVGYHLEQACIYRNELRLPADDDLHAAARRRLADAGRRAKLRGDFSAAANLLTRAAGLGGLDLALEADIADSLFWGGKGSEALARARALAERADDIDDCIGRLCGQIKEGLFQTLLQPEGATERLSGLLDEALPEFEAARDNVALSIAYEARCQVCVMRGQTDAMLEAADRAAAHAERAGRPHTHLLARQASARYYGTTPVTELLEWLDAQRAAGGWNERLDARQSLRALALAMLGRFDDARLQLAELRSIWTERGGGIHLANVLGHDCVDVERWAGNPAAAVEFGLQAMPLYEELQEHSFMSTAAAKLAHALYEGGRFPEARLWADRAAELGASDDMMTQMLWRQVAAKLLARAGQTDEAHRLAHEAVAVALGTDMLDAQADAYLDLAEVLAAVPDVDSASAALEEAIRRYEHKGNVVSARRALSALVTTERARGPAPPATVLLAPGRPGR